MPNVSVQSRTIEPAKGNMVTILMPKEFQAIIPPPRWGRSGGGDRVVRDEYQHRAKILRNGLPVQKESYGDI